jgi:nanoRNase/pAp phosphatase (c-di-AMP/oligoRNAs hydrolase)
MPEKTQGSYRLITRSDFDGLICAVLLKEKEIISDIQFVHPKDMQDGLIEVGPGDISANLPYVEGIFRAFDHHLSEMSRISERPENHIIDADAPSAARVIYEYYGGREAFPGIAPELMTAVDKGDSANFNIEEVLNPRDWVLLNFITDARTGLGRFKNFRISNYQLMMDLIDYCRDHSVEEVLALPDVKERVELYFEHQQPFREQIRANSEVRGNVLVVNMKIPDEIFAGNRFVKYALYPETNVSIQINHGYKREKTVFSVGKSIFNKSNEVDIGDLMLEFGGGGHQAAGTCQVDNEVADERLQTLINRLQD